MVSEVRAAELVALISGGETDKFYNSRTWRNKRKQILRRDRYECQRCKRRGKYRRADCVHHLKELKERPELALDDSNLEALCSQCHNAVHDRAFVAAMNKQEPVTVERW